MRLVNLLKFDFSRYPKIMIRFCSPFEAFVITLMVGAGSLITIVLKWADQLPSLNSIGENATFSHPFLQSTFMFLGELFCIALFYLQRWCRRSRRHININNGKNLHYHLNFQVKMTMKKVTEEVSQISLETRKRNF